MLIFFKSGYLFSVPNNCSYVLAMADTFKIIIDQEERYAELNDAMYMKQVRIKMDEVQYIIDDQFYVSLNI